VLRNFRGDALIRWRSFRGNGGGKNLVIPAPDKRFALSGVTVLAALRAFRGDAMHFLHSVIPENAEHLSNRHPGKCEAFIQPSSRKMRSIYPTVIPEFAAGNYPSVIPENAKHLSGISQR